jgi:hypothetical protein
MTETWVMVIVYDQEDFFNDTNHIYLETFSAEAFAGRGYATTTANVEHAMKFPSLTAVMKTWKTQSKALPLRPDGEPNRPLTAYTIHPKKIT